MKCQIYSIFSALKMRGLLSPFIAVLVASIVRLRQLSKHDVGDDLCSGVGIEAGGEFAALHVELLADDGGGELHIKRLVADGKVFGVARYDGPHHMLPSLYEAVLIEWGFETLLAQVLADEVTDGFGVGAAHVFEF